MCNTDPSYYTNRRKYGERRFTSILVNRNRTVRLLNFVDYSDFQRLSRDGDTKIERTREKITPISSMESSLGVSGDTIVLVLVYIGFSIPRWLQCNCTAVDG